MDNNVNEEVDINQLMKIRREKLDDLRKEGYYAGVCYGFEHAVRVIEKYLSMPKTTVL